MMNSIPRGLDSVVIESVRGVEGLSKTYEVKLCMPIRSKTRISSTFGESTVRMSMYHQSSRTNIHYTSTFVVDPTHLKRLPTIPQK